MAHQEQIFRPVAVPSKFLGAPRLLAACNICTWSVFCGVTAMDKYTVGFIVIFIVAMVPTHLACIYIGTIEPHIDSLIQTYYLTKVRSKTLGNTRSKIFYAG